MKKFTTELTMKNILLSLALAAPAALALDGITFDHEDWTLACDNTGTCRAAGYQSEPGIGDEGYPEPVSLLLTRKAGADAAVRAELQILPDIRDDKHLDTEATLTLNGNTLGTFTFSADNAVVTLDDKQTAAILAALPQKQAEIVVTAGERKMTLSDKGASAVLLKMDEFQQRIGTPSALIRKGKSDKAVLAPVAAPQIQAVPAVDGEPRTIEAGSAEHERLMKHFAQDFGENGDCARGAEEQAPAFTLYPLGGGRVLSETRCWTAAYNSANHYAILSEDLNTLVARVDAEAYGFSHQPHPNTLEGGMKGRGAGDCFWLENQVYNGETFVKSHVATTGLCRGFPGGAWEMPSVVSEVIAPK